MRILAAQINPTIGDIEGNTEKVIESLKRAKTAKADVVLFPELTLSGYPPEDLLLDPAFIDAIYQKLEVIRPETRGLFAAIGLPRWNPTHLEKPLYNSAAIFCNGELLGFKNKTLLPTYDVFDERRFFEPGKDEPVWEYLGRRIGITICEDVWQHANAVGYTRYATDPVALLKEEGIDLLLNLSASPYYFERKDVRLSVFSAAAKTLCCPVILCNQVGANDELVFDGNSLYLNEKGELIQKAAGFLEDDMVVDLEPDACPCLAPENGIKDLYQALVLGVRDYFHKQGFKKALLGLSGGIDSALVACIGVDALGAENVTAINMPTRYSSLPNIEDARLIAKNLGIELKEVPIDSMFQAYLDLLRPVLGRELNDLTEQNLQSRIRGMVLMAFSNQMGSLLLNTGNKSEMAMGYTTLYGDMCGAIGVLQDVTKQHVYDLAYLVNRTKERIPKDVLEKHPSAELKHGQKTEEALHPFSILDPILEDFIERRLSLGEIAKNHGQTVDFVRKIAHLVHLNEYKRRQTPIGIRVSQKAFSKGRNVPIVQKWR